MVFCLFCIPLYGKVIDEKEYFTSFFLRKIRKDR